MAGPLIGMIGKAGGAMFGSQVGAALGGLAGEVLTASDIGLPLGPAGKAALVPHNIEEFAEGLDVSDDDVLLYLSLREAAHQRLFAHVPWLRQHLISSVEDFGRGVTIDISGIEQAMGQLDPTNMEAIQEALQGGLFEPQQTARAEGRAGAARDHARAGRGLGRRGRRPGHGRADARRRQDAGGDPSSPRRRRSGGGDLRGAGRPRAAAPAAARRLDAVGLAALAPGQGGARRRLGPPRPAARPPPTSTTRSASARTCPRSPSSATRTSTRRSASCWTASPARPASDPTTTRRTATSPTSAGRAARVTLHADAVDVLTRWQAPTPDQERAARHRTSQHLAWHPDGLWRSCFPAHLTAGALVVSHDRRPRAAQPAPQGAALVPLRRSPRGRATPPWPAARCARPPRSPGLTGLVVDAEPLHLSRHPVNFCDRRGTVKHLDVRFLARAGRRRRAGGQRRVARRALVAGRRPAHRRAGHGRDDRPGPAASGSSAGRLRTPAPRRVGRSIATAWATPSR